MAKNYFSPEQSISRAREFIQNFYKNLGLPLPPEADDPQILQSLGVDLTRLKYITTLPDVRRIISDVDPRQKN